MPELPEVETIARQLEPYVQGRRITGVRVFWERTLGGAARATFGREVRGLRIEQVRRRGKYVVMPVSRAGVAVGALVAHLRMTGRLIPNGPLGASGPYTRLALHLDDGTALCFDDVRKFGRIAYVRDPTAFFGDLGIEPLSKRFTSAWLLRALRARRRMLKPLLLDQSVIAGLGNIYVDESLHRAALHPRRKSHGVPRARVEELHTSIRSILVAAIRSEGSTFDGAYRTPEGRPGQYQMEHRVYGRRGLPCWTCGRPIRRIVVGQRGTYLCARCQPPPRRPS